MRALQANVLRVQALDSAGALLDQGSGVRLRSGFIATNYHVVAAAAAIRLQATTYGSLATIARCSQAEDLCLLRPLVRTAAAPEGVPLAKTVSPGEVVYALGAPEGIPSVISQGLVSGLRLVKGSSRLVTSAPMSPGSSGGGLFNSKGALVGITAAQVTDGQDLNLAIPADQIKTLLDQRDASIPMPTLAPGVCIAELGTSTAAAMFREALIDALVQSGSSVEQDCDRATAELTGQVQSWTSAGGGLTMSYGLHLADSAGRVRCAWRHRRHGALHDLPEAMVQQLLPQLLAALGAEASMRQRHRTGGLQ